MWKWILGSVAVLMVLAGCGAGEPPPIAFPADGQQINLAQTPQFNVTLADNDYRNVSIEVRGTEAFEGELVCSNGVNSPATCSYFRQQFGGGFNQNCVEQRPCILVIIAREGNATAVRTVSVVRGTSTNFQQQQQPQ